MTYILVPDKDLNLVANFKNKVVTVNLNSNPLGVGKLNGAGNYLCNDSITSFSINSIDPCYTFLNWTDGAKIVFTTNPYHFYSI